MNANSNTLSAGDTISSSQVFLKGEVPVASKPRSDLSTVEEFMRNGYLTVGSLTTLRDIELIKSLLDPLFERFESLGERAVDIAM